MINRFRGEYGFLSNFHLCEIKINSVQTGNVLTFPSSEHAFMASKTMNPNEWTQFTVEGGLTPAQAKYAGRRVKLRPNWDEVKIKFMRKILMHKF